MPINTSEKESKLKKGSPDRPHGGPHKKTHPKHHGKKEHPRGKGLELVDGFDSLFDRVIVDPAERKWALDQIVNEGPDHKQVHAALLFRSMLALIVKLEKQSGKKFISQSGEKLISVKHDEEQEFPVVFPSSALGKRNHSAILELLSHAPQHELVLFSTLLQSIEWVTSAIPG